MRFSYIICLAFYFPVHDLLSAWLYDSGAFPSVGILRYLRDFSVILVAGIALISIKLPTGLRIPIWLYIGLSCVYALVGLVRGIPLSIVIGSFGTLLIPILLFISGYYCLPDKRRLLVFSRALLFIGSATAIFGIFDIQDTHFWAESIRFGDYLANIKSTETGLHPITQLPWNFYGGIELSRRAAGLLASPLAQGHFLAVTAILSFLFYCFHRNVLYLLAMSLMLFGIWQSGTRGAMLVVCVTVAGLMFTNPILFRSHLLRWISGALFAFAVFTVLGPIITMTIGLQDGSSPGHWRAFLLNILNLPSVLFFGHGIGFQGSVAARQLDLRDLLVGGGEGAIFSIAYQAGVPSALALLFFYWHCWKILSYICFPDKESEYICAIMKWILVGFAFSFIISETLLTFSGAAAFWITLGGTVRLCTIHSARTSRSSSSSSDRQPNAAEPATLRNNT